MEKEQILDNLSEEEEEVIVDNVCSNDEDLKFDIIMGTLQEILIEESFDNMNQQFLQKNYDLFDDNEENKQEYIIIFKDYQKVIEAHIQTQLEQRVKDFSMEDFLGTLEGRINEIEPEILDLLHSFSDFQVFKQLMLDFKKDYLLRNPHLNRKEENKEAKEEDFFNFKKNMKKDEDDKGVLEIHVTQLPTPMITKKQHDKSRNSWNK